MSIVAVPREGPTAGGPAPAFQKKLGLFDSTMLVAGTMIGSGIFITSAEIARDVGSTGWLMVVWLLAGVMTMMGALSYAELAAMMPHAGGQYVYLREAYSPLWGFLYGWTVFLIIQTGSIAAVGVAFAKFLGVLVPELGTDNVIFRVSDLDLALYLPGMTEPFFKRQEFTISAGQLVAVVIVVLLTLLNCRGVREGKWVQNIFTVAKTLALVVLIVLGVTMAINSDAVTANLDNMWDGITGTTRFHTVSQFVPLGTAAVALMVVGGAMVGSLFSADAWNNVTFTAGEVKNPRRNLPWSLALGAGLVILLYVLANVAYVAALPVRGDKALADKLQAQAEYVKAAANQRAAEVKELETRAAELKARARVLKLEGVDPSEVHRIHKEAELLTEQAKQQAADAATVDAASRAVLEADYQKATADLGIDHARDDRVATAALEMASPHFGTVFMAVAIMVSAFGCINGLVLMGARLYYAMARDRLFFQSVGQLNYRGVPVAGLLLQGSWSVVLIFSGTYGDLLDYVIFAALVFYVLTVIGLFILRRTQPDAERPYRAFGYPVVPALYVLLSAAIMVDLLVVKPKYTWPGLIIVLTGIPVYFFWRWTGERSRSAAESLEKAES
jgi:amino acid transporter